MSNGIFKFVQINMKHLLYDKDKQKEQKRIHKRSAALERSVRNLLEGLNMFNGTNLIIIIDRESGFS